jgi:hypothetical protein
VEVKEEIKEVQLWHVMLLCVTLPWWILRAAVREFGIAFNLGPMDDEE